MPERTLLFFDEIQECPRALISLRYFYEQMPDLHLIAAGSLSEFTFSEISFSVGRIQFEWLRPLGFLEFLQATRRDLLPENLPHYRRDKPIDNFIHEKLIESLNYYFVVGGMPEAVSAFSETDSLSEVSQIHKALYQSYIQDFVKYGSKVDVEIMVQIFTQLPVKVGNRIK